MTKKLQLVLGLAIAGLGYSSAAFGQYAGQYGFSIELDGTGALASHNGQTTLYAVEPDSNNAGAGNVPTGSTATLDTTDWTAASNLTTPVYNLGTFNPSLGDTLTLTGGSLLTYSGGGDSFDTTSATLDYGISTLGTNPATYAPISLPLDITDLDGAAGNDRFATEAQTINLLSGLSPGVYELGVFGLATYSGAAAGTVYANNAGANYAATFTVVVPEPASIGIAALSLGGLLLRRRSAIVAK